MEGLEESEVDLSFKCLYKEGALVFLACSLVCFNTAGG